MAKDNGETPKGLCYNSAISDTAYPNARSVVSEHRSCQKVWYVKDTQLIGGERIALGDGVPSILWRGKGDGPRPAVISVHGQGGSKQDIFPGWIERYAPMGITVVTIDAYLHGEWARDGFTIKDDDTYRPEHGMESLIQTASSLTHVVADLGEDEAIDEQRIGLRGGSLGGFIVLAAAVLGAKARAILSVCGGGNYEAEFPFLKAGNVVVSSGDSLSLLDIDPVTHATQIWPRPLLLIHGIKDESVPISCDRTVYDALAPLYRDKPGDCLFLTHSGGHETPMDLEDLGWAWLVRRLTD